MSGRFTIQKLEYEKISITDFRNLDAKQEEGNYYELRGVPRAVKGYEQEKIDEDYSYTLGFYLQEQENLITAERKSTNSYFNWNSHLLKAASESNIEILVRGICRNTKGNIAGLTINEAIVDGRELEL